MSDNAGALSLQGSEQQDSSPSSLVSVENQVSVESRCESDTQQIFDWKRLDSLKFAMQVILTAAILTLCVGKLTMSSQADDKALYWGGITGLFAWWMPSPNGTQSKSK